MGKTTCIWTPGVNKDLSGEPSALHSDLVEHTGDRTVANIAYAATRVKGGLSNFENSEHIEYDQNGEPTLESVNRVLPLSSMVRRTSLVVEKREIGAVDRKGNPIAYDSLSEVLQMVQEFNEQHPDLVAYPTEQDKKFFINVEYRDDSNFQKPQEAAFNNELNNSLLGIMRSLGFTATNDNEVAGIFDPLNATTTAEGLKTVIRVARGEVGEDAFPEEFAHFMIEGLQDHPLVQRILNSLRSEDALRQVLGEDYDRYAQLYQENGRVDTLRMQKEAAGKLLDRYIRQGELMETPAPQGLFQRLWNFIKNLFNRVSVSDVDRVINEANRSTAQLASQIRVESIIPYFNKTKIMDAKALYKVTEEVNKMQAIAEKGLEVASRRLKIVQSRSKGSRYKLADMRSIKNIQDLIDKKKYAASSLAFLQDSLRQLESIRKRMQALEGRKDDLDATNLGELRQGASTLRMVKEFADGYGDIVETMMRMPSLAARGEVELTEADAEAIAEKAKEVFDIINNLRGNYAELRYRVVYEFLKTYWGEDKVWDIGKNKGKKMTLAGILEMADKDINGIDRWISSLSDASDPLLSLVDKSVKMARARRDNQLESILADIRGIHKKLMDAGENTDFMFERDENGVPTGRIISNINFAKFNKERQEYIQSLKDQGLKVWQIKSRVEEWERRHTVKVVIDEDSGRTETIPKGLKEGDPYYIDRLSHLNKAQREYYDTMMQLKAALDERLPDRYTNTYNAVQIRNDMVEAISQNIGNPSTAIKMILGNMTDGFLRRVDDTDFGEMVEGDEEKGKAKQVTLDFSGNPIQKLPVYYTQPLEDMNRLSTDFTGAMLAYAGMAVDYGEMSKIVDVLELARDLAHDREVQQMSGDQKIVESFKVLHKEFGHTYTKKGGRIAERLDDYMDTVVYGRKKKDEGTVEILGQQVDVAKALDSLKSYTGVVGLGLNLFSGISNITVGKMQIFIDAVAGEYFGLKNSMKGMKDYYALLPAYLGEVNSTQKSNKLALLIDKYDALEEFYEGLKMQGKFKGPISRIIQGSSVYILNNLGEHYLHSRTMLAMLDRKKVKVNGKETSLFDAWKVRTLKDEKGNPISSELVLKNGTKDVNGNELFTEEHADELEALLKLRPKQRNAEQQARLQELLDIQERTNALNIEMKLRIGKVNQALNGAFNEADKGAIHRYALGRMAMQFRQWMPAHYSRRFASAYYDAQLEQFREGYYRTSWRFMINLISDLRHAKFQLATRWSKLSDTEKRNLRRAGGEMTLWAILGILCSMMGHWKDRKGNWGERLILYNLKRMKLDTEASVPWPPTFFANVTTILQSPAASINSFNNVASLVEFWNMFHEIQSGRYKGWSEWERDFANSVPLYGQIRKAVDISEENYMFNIFDK